MTRRNPYTRHRFLDRRPSTTKGPTLDVLASTVYIQDWQWKGEGDPVVKGGYMIVALNPLDAVRQGAIRLELEGNDLNEWECILNYARPESSPDLIQTALSIESLEEREYREAKYQSTRPPLAAVR